MRLALIAHDNKKVDLVAWATFNRETLARFSLIGTRHTAQLLKDKVGLGVEELLSGPEGGDAQIAALVATESVDAVFFFVDPLSAQPHEPDIRALLRCVTSIIFPLPRIWPRPISSSRRWGPVPTFVTASRVSRNDDRGSGRGLGGAA